VPARGRRAVENGIPQLPQRCDPEGRRHKAPQLSPENRRRRLGFRMQNDRDAPALGKRRLEYPSRQYGRIYSPAVASSSPAPPIPGRQRGRGLAALSEPTLATAASHREASVCPRRQPMNTAIIVAPISATWMDPAMPARPSSEPDMVNDFDALLQRQRIGVPCCGPRRTPRAEKRKPSLAPISAAARLHDAHLFSDQAPRPQP
jgi:hypothetical protein